MPPPSSPNPWRLAHASVEFAAGPLAGALIGYWIDYVAGSSPWGVLVGSLTGLLAGMGLFIMAVVRMNRENTARDPHPKGKRRDDDRDDDRDNDQDRDQSTRS